MPAQPAAGAGAGVITRHGGVQPGKDQGADQRRARQHQHVLAIGVRRQQPGEHDHAAKAHKSLGQIDRQVSQKMTVQHGWFRIRISMWRAMQERDRSQACLTTLKNG